MKPQFQQFNLRANCCRRHARSSICDSTARLSPSPNGHARLFQKFVRLAAQRLGDTDHAGKRKIVFAAFNAADERPVHVRAFSERFLRQGHFFPIRAHVLCQSLAILVFHARQVWKKKAVVNIDVNTIEFNTRHSFEFWQNRVDRFRWNFCTGLARLASDWRTGVECFQTVTEKSLDGVGGHAAQFIRVQMNVLKRTAGANGGATSQWQTTKNFHNISLSCPFSRLIHSSRTCTERTAIPLFAVLRCGHSTFMN